MDCDSIIICTDIFLIWIHPVILFEFAVHDIFNTTMNQKANTTYSSILLSIRSKWTLSDMT